MIISKGSKPKCLPPGPKFLSAALNVPTYRLDETINKVYDSFAKRYIFFKWEIHDILHPENIFIKHKFYSIKISEIFKSIALINFIFQPRKFQ